MLKIIILVIIGLKKIKNPSIAEDTKIELKILTTLTVTTAVDLDFINKAVIILLEPFIIK